MSSAKTTHNANEFRKLSMFKHKKRVGFFWGFKFLLKDTGTSLWNGSNEVVFVPNYWIEERLEDLFLYKQLHRIFNNVNQDAY